MQAFTTIFSVLLYMEQSFQEKAPSFQIVNVVFDGTCAIHAETKIHVEAKVLFMNIDSSLWSTRMTFGIAGSPTCSVANLTNCYEKPDSMCYCWSKEKDVYNVRLTVIADIIYSNAVINVNGYGLDNTTVSGSDTAYFPHVSSEIQESVVIGGVEIPIPRSGDAILPLDSYSCVYRVTGMSPPYSLSYKVDTEKWHRQHNVPSINVQLDVSSLNVCVSYEEEKFCKRSKTLCFAREPDKRIQLCGLHQWSNILVFVLITLHFGALTTFKKFPTASSFFDCALALGILILMFYSSLREIFVGDLGTCHIIYTFLLLCLTLLPTVFLIFLISKGVVDLERDQLLVNSSSFISIITTFNALIVVYMNSFGETLNIWHFSYFIIAALSSAFFMLTLLIILSRLKLSSVAQGEDMDAAEQPFEEASPIRSSVKKKKEVEEKERKRSQKSKEESDETDEEELEVEESDQD